MLFVPNNKHIDTAQRYVKIPFPACQGKIINIKSKQSCRLILISASAVFTKSLRHPVMRVLS
jgi:hypothetical protein